MCTMYYVLCAATIERYGRQGLNIYIYRDTLKRK